MYNGSSMHPTFKPCDILYVVPYQSRKIRCGDVVVFADPDNGKHITHRVISVDDGKIRTIGDNNKDIDKYLLNPENIIGRVDFVQRKEKRLPIYGGFWGRLNTFKASAARKSNSIVSYLLHPFYHMLASSGVLRRMLFFMPKIRAIRLSKNGREEFQLLLGNRIIGRRLPEKDRWHIAKPFKLFVDESSLPE
jgi:signal peptidase I